MKTPALILAHRLVAALQRTDPEADLHNAFSLTFLSVAPAVPQSELQHRLDDLGRIRARQAERATALLQPLLDQGLAEEQVTAVLKAVSELASVSTLEGVLNHLLDRVDAAGAAAE